MGFMLVHFLVVFPPHGALVLHADPVFPTEAFLVVHLGLVLLDLLDVVPPSCRLVLTIRLDTKFASEAHLVV